MLLPRTTRARSQPRQALYSADLALACFFSLNWLFWLWIAEDRLRYIFSLMTAIDFITIIPSFVLYGVASDLIGGLPGINVVRVLR